MKRNRLVLVLAAISMLIAALGNVAIADERAKSAPLKGEGENLKLIANLETGTCDSGWKGTDHENVEFGKRTLTYASSVCPVAENGGVYVIDTTNPAKPKKVGYLPCVLSQGDIQVSYDKKTLIVGNDSAGGPDSCLGLGKTGFLTVDITNPTKPKAIGYADGDGAHNISAHPTKPYVYVSNSSLVPGGSSRIEIWSIKNPAKPELVGNVPSVPNAPHDVSFNKKGTKIVTAAISHWDVFDTTDPEAPVLEWTGQCPGCSITHDAKFTPNDKNILIGDEGGGGGTYPCPGGAWYVYDYSTGTVPVLTGVYEPANFITNQEGGTGGCTSHVFEISDDSTKIAISWYTLGTRYLDITTAVGLTVGDNRAPTGIKECGWFVPEGGDSWSSKFSTDQKYITSNDINRGFDVYKITDTECAG